MTNLDLETEQDLHTISGRWHFLMDQTGNYPIKRGRPKALADRFGWGLSSAKRYCYENKIPKPSEFERFVSVSLEEAGAACSSNSIMSWIERGGKNPFVDKPMTEKKAAKEKIPTHEIINPTQDSVSHATKSQIYVAVDKTAYEMGIELDIFPTDQVDNFYDMLIDLTLDNQIRNFRSESYTKLIRTLLSSTFKRGE